MASNIADTARDTGSGLMDSIRENPLPAALIGIGVGWLFLSARRRAAERDRWRPRYESGYYDRGYGRYGPLWALVPAAIRMTAMASMGAVSMAPLSRLVRRTAR